MSAEPEPRPLEAEDGDSNVSYRPAASAKPGAKQTQPLHAKSVAPTGAKAQKQPVRESEVAGTDDARRAKILRSERYGPTSGKL